VKVWLWLLLAGFLRHVEPLLRMEPRINVLVDLSDKNGPKYAGGLLPSVRQVSEKNSSRKLAEQARLPTPRYQWGIFFARLCSVQCDSSGGGCPTPRRVFIKAGAGRRSLLAGTNKSACSLIYSPSWQLVFMPYTPLSPSSLELLQVPALAAGGFLSYQFLTLTR
jgi:hypothetical protein